MSIMIVFSARLNEEKKDSFADFFAEILPDTRGFDGCEGITVCTDSEDDGRLYLIEKWASKEHYEKYHHWRDERGDLEIIRSYLDLEAGGIQRVFLDVVDV